MHHELRPSLGAGSPHLNQVELGEEAHALGCEAGGGAALLGCAVDGRSHRGEQEEEEAAQALSQQPPPPARGDTGLS